MQVYWPEDSWVAEQYFFYFLCGVKATLTESAFLLVRLPASVGLSSWFMNRYLAIVAQLLVLLLPATLMAQTGASKPADSLSVVNLDEVVVTGTGTNYLLKNAPVQTEIINAKTLESYGSATLTEILSGLIPSIDFSHSDMGTAMQMGGLGDRYILILVDGKRLMSDLGGQTNLDMVDPTRIERIEVVKGASCTYQIYGCEE